MDKNPPFAFMIYEGESRCTAHLPAPAVVESEPPQFLPNEFPPLEVVCEEIQTDNIYVVPDSEPKKIPAKKTAAKRVPRKRTKS